MENIDIRILVSNSGLKYKDIAKEMNVTREWLSRLMGEPLTGDNKTRILKAIMKLKDSPQKNVECKSEKKYEEPIHILSDLYKTSPAQQNPNGLRGWICPICGRGLSPMTSVCPCNNGKGWEITC